MAESTAANSGTEQKQESSGTWRVHVKGYEAVILYPSLVTPAIVERGMDKGCMTVILAVKDDFKDNYKLFSPKPIDSLAAQALHSQLCMMPWGDGAVPGPADFQYIGFHRYVISWRHMIYLNHIDAMKKWDAKDYQGWYLGEMKEDTDFLVEGFEECKNKEKKEKEYQKTRKWGVIHHGAATMHVQHGYKHLIQLDFKNFFNLTVPGMYELNYVYFKLYNDESDIVAIETEVPKVASKETGKEEAWGNPSKEPMRSDYTDPDDDMISRYFAEEDRLAQKPEILRHPIEIKARKSAGFDQLFRLYRPYGETEKEKIKRPSGKPDDKADDYEKEYAALGPYLQSRHPVYIPEDWHGRIGVVADLHVSSRQNLYPLVNAQVIPGAKPEISPYLGKIVHNNLESATALMHEIAKQSDLLVITGDLYDHSRNLDPLAETITTTGELWQALNYKPKDPYNKYPREIDGLLLLSRILNIYDKHGRPVLYVSGNHEAYENPYGISPRVKTTLLSDFMQLRANQGVSSDHNLTFYEACLLYGPGSFQTGTEVNIEKMKKNIGEARDGKIEEAREKRKASERTAHLKPDPASTRLFAAFEAAVDEVSAKVEAWAKDGALDLAPDDIFYDTSKNSNMSPKPPPDDWKLNFRPENFDWLYCLYTPWKDFVISYGSPAPPPDLSKPAKPAATDGADADEPEANPASGRYNFIALGWGDKEDFLTTTACGTGSLPRSPAACTEEQVSLTKWAVDSGAEHNIVLSHFTFISYDRDKPFDDEDAKIDLRDGESDTSLTPLVRDLGFAHIPVVSSWRSGHSPYDIGSFYKNRRTMYEMVMGNNIHYSICGHSHRAGAYAFEGTSWFSLHPGSQKASAKLDSNPKQPDRLAPVGKNKVLVCGASGPFSYQNHKGELGGFGMDLPQGLILDVPKDAVTWKKWEKLEQSKRIRPRLAVVLDYLWYAGDCPPFIDGSLRRSSHCFDFGVSNEFRKAFNWTNPFRQITLIAVVQDNTGQIQNVPLLMSVSNQVLSNRPYDPDGRWVAGFTPASWKEFKNKVGKVENVLQHFLSITFQEVAGVTAENYDLDSPWCFPVTVEGDYKRIYRPTDRIGGELPKWDWYLDNGGGEYGKSTKK